MDAARDLLARLDAIRHATYMVRHYERGARSSIQRLQREQAIQQLALILLAALQNAGPGEYEPILTTVVDGLCPRHDHRF